MGSHSGQGRETREQLFFAVAEGDCGGPSLFLDVTDKAPDSQGFFGG